MFYRTHALHKGPLFSVHDVDCCAPASGCGSDEHATSHHMVFVRNGVFVKHIGKREIVGDASRVLFFNLDETYRVSHPVDGGDACTMVTCSPSAWREILARHDDAAADRPNGPFTLSHATQSWHAAVGYRRLRTAMLRGTVDALEVEETTLRLIDDVLAGTQGPRSADARPKRRATRHARRDLAEHTAIVLAARPAERHSLGQLARAVNSSPFHLARVFREETGTSIHQHLLKLRLSLALDRVLDQPDSLSEVAYALGFSSHAHFTSLFRRAFGVTPSAMRGAW